MVQLEGEMVVPAAESRMLRSGVVGASGNEIVSVLNQILYAVQEVDFSGMKLDVNNREFARLVKESV